MNYAFLFVLFFTSISVNSEENFFTNKNAYKQPSGIGCKLGDKIFPVGTRKQMNAKELAMYKQKTGFNASDGYAVMMQCLYLVDPLAMDHPVPEKREFVWVAS
ncbi:MAG: hypothetical protein CMB99_02880 [Flavobacteriaceae bacterium]|nr:hypothetical protein [Flavobacteriaceae bacterium]|tara:strand:+ start:2067 stop:2375 length:309 start_codon:yes stop_codon:yes gene_type:complete